MKNNDECDYWVYMLHCSNNTYYTGYTTDVFRRYQEHCAGTASCKYTRSFKPLCIAQCWKIEGDKSTAMRIERYVKKLSRKEKIHLIDHPKALTTLFDCRVFTLK